MNKKFHGKILAFVFVLVTFSTLRLGFAQGTPDTTTIFSANFNADADSFKFAPDLFRGTNEPNYASGDSLSSGGFDGGALRVQLGGVPADSSAITDSISGGWQRDFTLDAPKTVIITFRYNLSASITYEPPEFSQVLLDVDGVLYGNLGNDYIVQLDSEVGESGPMPTTGWQLDTLNLGVLANGLHTITIGGYNNQSTRPDETTEILIDDVHVRGASIVGNAPETPTLTSPNNNAIFNATAVSMVWPVPVDADGDSLHFEVQIAQSMNFSSSMQFNSSSNPAGFFPVPPVLEGVSSMVFQVPADSLGEGDYFWRVRAFDGENFGNYSETRRFLIDTIDPEIDSLTLGNPAPNYLRSTDGAEFYNQATVDSVDLTVFYDEANVATLTYTLGALAGSQPPTVTSGVDKTNTVRLNISGQSDGTYPLTVTIIDSANNSDSEIKNIFLDSTPPTGTLARKDSVVSKKIYLSWGNGSDGVGSGVSDTFRVQYQINNSGVWQPLLLETTRTDTVFEGEHGNTYGFEAAVYDNVGNLEVFLNFAEVTVPIDTSGDVLAPGAPIQLMADDQLTESPWKATDEFKISWQNPPDPSGIARVFYKLGSAPVSNDDFTGSEPAQAESLDVTVTQENGENLFLWLSDNAGNADFQSYSSVLLRYDATAPTGTIATAPDTSTSLTFNVSWGGTGSDGSGSGLSGVYEVRVQVDGGPFTTWPPSKDTTSYSFEGLHGHTYGFEVAAYDLVGNLEAFTGIAEKTTLVDTLGFDNEPPGQPRGIAANEQSPRSPWLKIPRFAVAWNPPEDVSGISYAIYKIGSPPIANYDTTNNGYGRTVPSDTNSIIVTVRDEGVNNFYIWFVDGRGNVDFNNHGVVQLRYDATSPTINNIEVNNPDFSPNWFRTTLTSQAEIQVNYSEDHAESLRFQSPALGLDDLMEDIGAGTDVSDTAFVNLSSAADGSYDVQVTLTDGAGNSATDTLALGVDNTAPTGATAISPDTSANTTFRVSWGSASDGNGSGLSGAYNVRYQENGGPWVNWQTDFSGTSHDFTGQNGVKYGFEVVAIDNVGNVEPFQNIAEDSTIIDTVFVDATAPTVTHTPLVSVDLGTDITIEVQVTDNNQIDAVNLFYRENGLSSFQSVAMLPSPSADIFTVTIPAAQVSALGLSYYIQTSDGINNTFSPATNWDTMPYNISIRITGEDARGIVKSTTQPSGSDGSAYRMISIPLNLDQGSVIDVLQDDLGTYDPVVWRLYQYITATGGYVEYPDVIDFSPGKAMWLIVKNSDMQLDSGIGTSVPANVPFEITLSQGWNDIGNPFQFNVDVSNIVVALGSSGGVQGPYTYEGQWLLPNQINQLKPWEGYSFFSDADNVTIAINPIAATTSPSTQKLNNTLDVDWTINIKAHSGELRDENSQIGVSASASESWDELDFLEPPFLSDRVSVKFPHHDWDKFPGNFKSDFQPSSKQGWVWYFEAETSHRNEKIKLVFDNLNSLPGNLKTVLIDRDVVQKIELSDGFEYEFLPNQESLLRKFELVVGTDEFVNNSKNILSLVPDEFYLSQNYPNPFNAGTKLVYHTSERTKVKVDIMNILGQKVTTLINELKEPGVYTLNWDGRGAKGIEVPSGVYFVKMQAGSFQAIRKMLYIR